jgi:hypothetical protein
VAMSGVPRYGCDDGSNVSRIVVCDDQRPVDASLMVAEMTIDVTKIVARSLVLSFFRSSNSSLCWCHLFG